MFSGSPKRLLNRGLAVVHILVVSHTCINPFIYCWMNRRVRYGFMDVMGEIVRR